MHAVMVKVTVGDFDVALKGLHELVVPRVAESPGFVTGYWTRPDEGNNGVALIVYESDGAARAAAERIRSGEAVLPETVTLNDVEVREVVAHA